MDLSPGAVDPLIRRVTVERFSRTLDIAALLGAGTVVFHSGYERWKYDHRPEVWLEGSLRTWEPLAALAESKGLGIAIENIFEDEPSNLKMLAEAVGAGNFGLCFDTGHFNIFSRTTLEEWLEVVGPYLTELHLHDNDGTRDSHLAPGEGTFDFDALFRILEGLDRKDLVVTVETHSLDGVERSITFLTGSADHGRPSG